MTRLLRSALVCAIVFVSVPTVTGYERETHRQLTNQAAEPGISSVDDVLKLEVGIRSGVAALFGRPLSSPPAGSLAVRELLGQGSSDEDVPFTRSLSHFHNPLAGPWSAAGLDSSVCSVAPVRGQSSALWQQNPAQDEALVQVALVFPSGGGNWSWQDARRRYLTALTGLSNDQREQGFAETFLSLGHLVHAVQDATVPAHTRNDPHPPICGRADGYERWVDAIRRTDPALFTGLLQSPAGPSASVLGAGTGDAQAPVPIARLIDTRTFLGGGVAALNSPNQLGVAEYTNGNFLSGHTRFRMFELPRQPYPQDVLFEPEGRQFARYFSKRTDGETIQHFVREGMLYDSLEAAQAAPVPSGGWVLDRRVHRDYAGMLLPHAVGYSAALLDYFFRGKLEAMIEEDPADSQGLQLTGKNVSPDALGNGDLEVWGDYPNGDRIRLGSWAISGPVAPGADLPSQPLKFLPKEPIPSRYMAVYRGDLGDEKKDNPPGFEGAVIGKAVTYAGIIEELILFKDGANWDVYYRNDKQITLLDLRAFLPDSAFPRSVKWGVDGNAFFVEIAAPAQAFVIFRVKPLAGHVRGATPVVAEYVKTITFQPRGTPYSQTVVLPGYPTTTTVSRVTRLSQPVLSEDEGETPLEIYGSATAVQGKLVYTADPRYVPENSQGGAAIGLILQASTTGILYTDPLSISDLGRVNAAADSDPLSGREYESGVTITLLSWSDTDPTKRRWYSVKEQTETYSTYFIDEFGNRIATGEVVLEDSFESAVVEAGVKQREVDERTNARSAGAITAGIGNFLADPSWPVNYLSTSKYLFLDQVIAVDRDVGVTEKVISMFDIDAGRRTPIWSWTRAAVDRYGAAPKMRGLIMLEPGLLYAFDESPWLINIGYVDRAYEFSDAFDYNTTLLAEEIPISAEQRKFIRFRDSKGDVDSRFLSMTASTAGLVEDNELAGQGRVRTANVPPGFQVLLDQMALNYDEVSSTVPMIAWRAMLDPELVPSTRR